MANIFSTRFHTFCIDDTGGEKVKKISDSEIEELTVYAVKAEQVTVPQIQQHFEWSYSKARQGVDLLVDKKKLKYKNGIIFQAVDRRDEEDTFTIVRHNPSTAERIFGEFKRSLDSIKNEELPFSLCQEEDSIKSYIKIMDGLYTKAYGIKPRTEQKKEKPPAKYLKLAGDVKPLVNAAIKFEAQKTAHISDCFKVVCVVKAERNAKRFMRSPLSLWKGLRKENLK